MSAKGHQRTSNGRSLLVIVVVLVAAAGVYYPFSPAGVQRRNMQKAAAHVPHLAPLLASPRFRHVTVVPYTGPRLGGLLVRGSVASDQDLAYEILLSLKEYTNAHAA